MIELAEREKLEKYKPVGYVQKVLDYLKEKNITNYKGKPYNPVSVRMIYNAAKSKGRFKSNTDIENAIFNVFAAYKQQLKTEKLAREKILN